MSADPLKSAGRISIHHFQNRVPSIVSTMGHIAWLEERVSGFVYGRLITFHVREFAGHDHPDARTGMIVVTNVAARLICQFGNAEFVLAIQIGHMTRDNLLKTLYGLHVLRLNT